MQCNCPLKRRGFAESGGVSYAARGLDAERIRKTRSLLAPHVHREGGREGTQGRERESERGEDKWRMIVPVSLISLQITGQIT